MPEFTDISERLIRVGLEVAGAEAMHFDTPEVATNSARLASLHERINDAGDTSSPLVEVTFVDFNDPELPRDERGFTPVGLMLIDEAFQRDVDDPVEHLALRCLRLEVQSREELAHRIKQGRGIEAYADENGAFLRLPERRGPRFPLRTLVTTQRVDRDRRHHPGGHNPVITTEPWHPDVNTKFYTKQYKGYGKRADAIINRSSEVVGL